MKLNKRELFAILQKDYIGGASTLQEIADRFGCTRAAIALVGANLFPDWKAHTSNRPYRVVKFCGLIVDAEGVSSQVPGPNSPKIPY